MMADTLARFPLDHARLAEVVAERRRAGGRIVFTNGVFDLLHFGHIQYLRRARALGDMLVIGMNSDASTRRLKGPERPLVPQEERASLLAELRMVDAVTIFDDDTASPLIELLRPDIYVKGGDYATPDAASAPREYVVGPDDLRRLVESEAPRDLALAPLAGLPARLPEATTVAAYGGGLALLAYLPGHSTSELIQRIVSRYVQSGAETDL